MASIKYNGKTLVNVRSGESVTLHTTGHSLTGDIEIDGYGEPVAEAVLIEQTFDANGEYLASNDNADGYSKVTVAVPIPDGYIKPSGTLEIDKNGTHSVTEYASVNVAVPIPTVTTEEATVTPTKATQTVTPTNADYIAKVTVNPIPDNFIEPTGTLSITENGTHPVTEYANVSVAVPAPEGDTLKTFLTQKGDCSYLFYNMSRITKLPDSFAPSTFGAFIDLACNMFSGCRMLQSVPLFDTSYILNMGSMFSGCEYLADIPVLNTERVRYMEYTFYNCKTLKSGPEWNTSSVENMRSMFEGCVKLNSVPLYDTSNVTSMEGMFNGCKALTTVPLFDTSKVTSMMNMFKSCTALTTVPLFDTSKVTSMYYMFDGCTALTTVPLFDTSNVTETNYMFNGCKALTTVPLFDTSNVTGMGSMFKGCTALTTIPLFDTSKVTSINNMFDGCKALTTVPALDMRSSTYSSSMFNSCTNLTDIQVRNIKTSLQVSSGTSYGHLLTVDSLIHLISELRKQSSTLTLTISTANLPKIADVYVKLIDITDEMRAEDDLIDEKYPFVVCESTDEGAMLIKDYASQVKNWTVK